MERSSARLAHKNCKLPSVVRSGDCLALSCFSWEKGSLHGVLSLWKPLLLVWDKESHALHPSLLLLPWGPAYRPVLQHCQPGPLVISDSRPTWVVRAVFTPPWSKPRHPRKAQVLLGAQRPWAQHQNHSASCSRSQHPQLGT